LGHVGSRLATLYSPHCELVAYDIKSKTDYPFDELAECDLTMICVGTPQLPNGAADLSSVRAALKDLPTELVIIRSTVPPGTTAQLSSEFDRTLLFMPEYVGETSYIAQDWTLFEQNSHFLILGGEVKSRQVVLDLLMPIHGSMTRILQCSTVEAETIKYMENSYFACKITFVSEFYRFCERMSLDWHLVREGWLMDPRVERDHTGVFNNGSGYGGRCLPKDVRAIIKMGEGVGHRFQLMEVVDRINSRCSAATSFGSEADDEIWPEVIS
jgi:nucleotide sugar dehydrogenase